MSDGRAMAKRLSAVMQCNCNLDSWQPEPTTGHSCVCRIHKTVYPLLNTNEEYAESRMQEIEARATATHPAA